MKEQRKNAAVRPDVPAGTPAGPPPSEGSNVTDSLEAFILDYAKELEDAYDFTVSVLKQDSMPADVLFGVSERLREIVKHGRGALKGEKYD
jgi:hypothetical protein